MIFFLLPGHHPHHKFHSEHDPHKLEPQQAGVLASLG